MWCGSQFSILNSPFSIHKVESGDGVEGGGFGAQACGAECDGLETLGEDFGYLVGTEIPFGADEDEGVGAGGVELAEGVALIARAVADEFLRIEN